MVMNNCVFNRLPHAHVHLVKIPLVRVTVHSCICTSEDQNGKVGKYHNHPNPGYVTDLFLIFIITYKPQIVGKKIY